MKQKKIFFLLFLSLVIVKVAYGQESMVSDISYPYLDRLIDIAKKNYPEVQIKQHQSAIAKNNIVKSRVSWLDAFNFSYFYRPADKNVLNPVDPYIFNGYQLGVSLNLGTLLQKPFATKEAKEQYKVARLEQQEYDLNIESEVKKRYFTYIEQLSLLKLRTRSTSDANDVSKQLKSKFEKGEIKFEEYNSALIVATEQNQYKIQAESGTFMAKASLEEIIGDKLENVK